MPRMLLIQAGPTPWDEEDRVVGSRPLPLNGQGTSAITALVGQLSFPVERVYCPAANEACAQAAAIVAAKFELRVKDEPGLEEIRLGLWEGLTREELRFRFPSVFPQWEEDPLSVNPPDGEPLAEAINRLSEALIRIRRRARGKTTALVLRPLAMQVVIGLFRKESPALIATHLRESNMVETIE